MAITTAAVAAITTDWTDCGALPLVAQSSSASVKFALADTKPSDLTIGFRFGYGPLNLLTGLSTATHLWIIGTGTAIIAK